MDDGFIVNSDLVGVFGILCLLGWKFSSVDWSFGQQPYPWSKSINIDIRHIHYG